MKIILFYITNVASQICNVLFKLSAFIDLGCAVAVELISVLMPIISCHRRDRWLAGARSPSGGVMDSGRCRIHGGAVERDPVVPKVGLSPAKGGGE